MYSGAEVPNTGHGALPVWPFSKGTTYQESGPATRTFRIFIAIQFLKYHIHHAVLDVQP